MKKKAKKRPEPTQELSPMAQSIMQKLAEHDKTKGLAQEAPTNSDDSSTKNSWVGTSHVHSLWSASATP